jgi:hypothetical protein
MTFRLLIEQPHPAVFSSLNMKIEISKDGEAWSTVGSFPKMNCRVSQPGTGHAAEVSWRI